MSQTGTISDVGDGEISPPATLTNALVGKQSFQSRRWFALAALSTCAGSVALFLLLQSTILWQIYSPVQDQFPQLFGWLSALFPNLQQRTPAGYESGRIGLILYMAVIAFLFVVYLLAIRQARVASSSQNEASRLFRGVMLVTAGLLGLFMLAREIYAVDVFAYSWFGRIWGLFGDNPYMHVPLEYASRDAEGWLPYLYWQDLPAPYGPAWVLLAGGVAKAASIFGTSIAYHVIGHKLVVSAAYLFATWLIWKIANRFLNLGTSSTSLPLAIAIAFAWNPLMLIEFGISAHNDLLMLVLVLLGLYLHLLGRWQWAVLALALAFLVKFTALVFLPGYLWLLIWQRGQGETTYTWAQRFLKVGAASLIFLATCVVFYVPFWQGPTTLNVLYDDPTARFYVHSFGAIFNRKLPELFSALGFNTETLAGGTTAVARWLPLLITAVVAIRVTWPARTTEQMIRAWGWTIFTLLTVGLAWFWPWYVAWLIVPALLSRDTRLQAATVLLSFTSLSVYLVGEPLRDVWPDVRLWTGLWIMGLPLLYVGYSFLQERRRTRASTQNFTASNELSTQQTIRGSN